jgi:hypothetical protein
MISLMNRLVDVQFGKDRSGRLVFIPFTRRGKCYFVDSKPDEQKVRASNRHGSRFDPRGLRWFESPSTQVDDCFRDLWVFLAGVCCGGIDALGGIQSSGSRLDCLAERGRT